MSRRGAQPRTRQPVSRGFVIGALVLAAAAAVSGYLSWRQRPPVAPGGATGPVPAPPAALAQASPGSEHQAEGRRLVQEGRAADALAAFERAVAADPGNAAYLGDLGAALLQAGDSLGAEATLARALELAPESVMARCNAGLAKLQLGRLAEAEAAFRLVISQSGGQGKFAARAHEGLSRIFLQRSVRPGGLDPALVQAAIEEGRTSVGIADTSSARMHLAEALLAALDGSGAIEQLRAAARIAPRDPAPLVQLSRASFEMDRLDEAVAAAREALALDPASPSAQLALGVALEVKGDDEGAVPALRAAAEAEHAGRADAQHRLARVLRRLGRDAEADEAQRAFDAASASVEQLKDLRRQSAAAPTSALAQYNLGVALERAGDLDEALRAHQLAAALDPDLAVAHANMGILLARRGAVGPAGRALRRALAIDPANVPARHGLGALQLRTGDFAGAVASLQEALKAEPARDGARLDLAMALANLGRVDDARKELERLIASDPRNVAARVNLAELLRHQGDRAGAISQLEKAVAAEPGNDEARRRLEELRAAAR